MDTSYPAPGVWLPYGGILQSPCIRINWGKSRLRPSQEACRKDSRSRCRNSLKYSQRCLAWRKKRIRNRQWKRYASSPMWWSLLSRSRRAFQDLDGWLSWGIWSFRELSEEQWCKTSLNVQLLWRRLLLFVSLSVEIWSRPGQPCALSVAINCLETSLSPQNSYV